MTGLEHSLRSNWTTESKLLDSKSSVTESKLLDSNLNLELTV